MALMPNRILVPQDYGSLEIRNVTIQNLASPPGSPATGQIYYKTGTGAGMYYYDGASWLQMATGTVANATTGAPGLIQLAGDLGGSGTTATSPVLLAANTSLTSLANVVTINPTANLNLGGAVSGNTPVGVSIVPTVTGNGAAATPVGFSIAPSVVAGGTGTPVLTGIRLIPAITTTGFNSLAPVGVNVAPSLALAATTGQSITLFNVGTHTGTATGATVTSFTAFNVAAQTPVTNVTYSGNAYGLLVNNPALTGATNYAARFVGNTQFTGSIDATGQTITASTFSGNATTATNAGNVTGIVAPVNGGTGIANSNTVTNGNILVGNNASGGYVTAALGGQAGATTISAGAGTLAVQLAAANTVITSASALATINPTSTLALGGVLAAANTSTGITASPNLTGSGATPSLTAISSVPTFTPAVNSAVMTGEAKGAVLTLASTTGHTYYGINVAAATGTATAASINTFAGVNVASQAAITNVTGPANAYGVLAAAPAIGTANYGLAAAAAGGTVVWKVDGSGVVTQNGALVFGSTTAINSSGVLQAAAVPAFTGDMTTAGGALATTVVGASGTFYVGGSANAKLKSATANLMQVRNNADNAYGDLQTNDITAHDISARNVTISGDLIQSSGTIVRSTDVFALLNDGATSFTNNPQTLSYASGQFTNGAGIIVERYNTGTTRQDVAIAAWDESNLQVVQTVISGATTNQRRVASSYAVDCAAATTTTVTHSFGTKDVHVSVYDKTNFNYVQTDVQSTDVNTVTVNFSVAPTAGQYRIVVVG